MNHSNTNIYNKCKKKKKDLEKFSLKNKLYSSISIIISENYDWKKFLKNERTITLYSTIKFTIDDVRWYMHLQNISLIAYLSVELALN